MQPKDFLDPVTRALIFPPKESIRLINDIAAGTPPPLDTDAYANAALGDAASILRTSYRPPVSALVAIPHEDERFDVIRAIWTTPDGLRLHMAQTQFVIAIWGEGLVSNNSTLDAVKDASLKILEISPGYTLDQWGRAEGRSFGGHNPGQGGWEDADWPHWRDVLRWWSGEGRLAFVTLKASGGPTRQPISYDPEENVDWF